MYINIFSILYILITFFLVRQVRCPQLVEGTFPLSYYSFDTLIKLLLLLLFAVFLNSCLLRRHSLSNHFLLDILMCRFLIILIFTETTLSGGSKDIFYFI